VQKHIEGNRVAGVSLQCIEWPGLRLVLSLHYGFSQWTISVKVLEYRSPRMIVSLNQYIRPTSDCVV